MAARKSEARTPASMSAGDGASAGCRMPPSRLIGATPDQAGAVLPSTIEAAQFGQLGDQGARGLPGRSPRTLAKKVGVFSARQACCGSFPSMSPSRSESFALQQFQMPVDRRAEPARWVGPAPTIASRPPIISTTWRRRATNSPSACAAGSQRSAGQAVGSHPSAKWAIDRGVEPIGLGELAGRAREVAHLAGVDHRQRQMSSCQCARHHRFVTAGRFHDDQQGSERAQPLDQLRRNSPSRATAKAVPNGRRCTSRRSFDTSMPTNVWLHIPSLRMRARLRAAPATVRAREEAQRMGRRAQKRAHTPQVPKGSHPRPQHQLYPGAAMNERYKVLCEAKPRRTH